MSEGRRGQLCPTRATEHDGGLCHVQSKSQVRSEGLRVRRKIVGHRIADSVGRRTIHRLSGNGTDRKVHAGISSPANTVA